MRLDQLARVVQALRRGPCSLVCAGVGAGIVRTGAAALRFSISCHDARDVHHGTAQSPTSCTVNDKPVVGRAACESCAAA